MLWLLQEHFYDPQSGSGYLAWRIKTVQRTAAHSHRSSTTTTYQDSPKRKREVFCTDEQLLGEHCHEAISFLKHSTDESAIKEKMRATFQYRQTLVQDQQCSSTVLDVFPRFLDITGLVIKTTCFYFLSELSLKLYTFKLHEYKNVCSSVDWARLQHDVWRGSVGQIFGKMAYFFQT